MVHRARNPPSIADYLILAQNSTTTLINVEIDANKLTNSSISNVEKKIILRSMLNSLNEEYPDIMDLIFELNILASFVPKHLPLSKDVKNTISSLKNLLSKINELREQMKSIIEEN